MLLPERNIDQHFIRWQQEIALGDHSAFEQLYVHFQKRLFAFAFTLSRSREIAATAVEDVFVKLWVRRTELPEIENISVYLYVSVRNQCVSYLSQKGGNPFATAGNSPDTEVEQLHADPHSILVTAEMLTRMNQAIKNLPPRCRMIFKMIREDGLRYKEVAEIMKISVNTIDVQMSIAVKRICEAVGVTKDHPARR